MSQMYNFVSTVVIFATLPYVLNINLCDCCFMILTFQLMVEVCQEQSEDIRQSDMGHQQVRFDNITFEDFALHFIAIDHVIWIERRNFSKKGSIDSFLVSGSSGQAGAVDEDYFQSAFENVKKVTIFSGRSLEDEINKIHSVLNNSQADWKLRVDNLMMVRSLLVAGAG